MLKAKLHIDRDTERKVFCLLVYCPNGHNSGARSFQSQELLPDLPCGGGSPSTLAICICFTRHFSKELD